jgi:hypothetical protein
MRQAVAHELEARQPVYEEGNMAEDDLDTLVTVFRTTDQFTASMIQGELEQQGIECRLGGMTQAYLPCVGTIEVLVRRRDVDRALPVLKEFEKNPQPDGGFNDDDFDENVDDSQHS